MNAWTKMDARNAAERLAAAREKVGQARRALRDAVSQAATWTDPDGHLTAEGVRAERERRAQAARDRYLPELEQLRAQVESDRETVARYTERARPRLGDDAAAATRAALTWEGVRARLDAGMSPARILATADADTALVLEQYGPAWLEARAYAANPHAEPDPGQLAGFRAAVAARLEEVTTGDARDALRIARRAELAAAGVGPLLEDAAVVAAGGQGDALASAIASRLEVESAERAAAAWQADDVAAPLAGTDDGAA